MSAPERWTRVQHRRTRYREAGSGPAVVLVHGLGLSCDFWRRHYDALAGAGLRVIAPDLPGFGESDRSGRAMDVAETAAWLLDFADTLELTRPAWLGHSLAAQPVLRLAAERPDRASALVLASPTGAPLPARRLRQAVGLVRDLAREPLALFPAVLREYVRAWPLDILGTWWKAGRDQPLRWAPRVRCPTLVTVARRDPLVPPVYLWPLIEALADGRVGYIRDGAHGVAYGNAEAFNRALEAFLTDVLGRTR